jgi:hypothetical protein
MAIARTKEDGSRSHRRPLRLIPIASHLEQVPPWAREFHILIRPDLLSEDSEYFVQELRRIFENASEETGAGRNTEPRRLFEAKEYRAAVIAAMTLLEATLRQRLSKAVWTEVERPMPLRQLLERAVNAQTIELSSREEISGWSRLRNEAVHTAKSVSKAEARAVVEGVERILGLVP